jgi:hypothetical protein
VDFKKISYPPTFLDIDVYFSYVVCTLRKKINVKPRVRIKHNTVLSTGKYDEGRIALIQLGILENNVCADEIRYD